MLKDIKMTGRVKLLKDKMLAQERYMSVEQALITTEIYKTNEDKPVIIKRALALKAALEKIEIAAEPRPAQEDPGEREEGENGDGEDRDAEADAAGQRLQVLRQVLDPSATGLDQHDAAIEAERAQRCDDRGDAEIGDQQSVQRTRRHAGQHAERDRQGQADAGIERHAERGEELAQGFLLGERGCIVNAVDQRLALLLQRFGGADIRLDHHLFDKLVRIEPLRHENPIDGAVRLQQDLALRHIELKRLATVTARLHDGIGGP